MSELGDCIATISAVVINVFCPTKWGGHFVPFVCRTGDVVLHLLIVLVDLYLVHNIL
jgi:hypothetical protein